MLEKNQTAPDFKLQGDDGAWHTLKEHAGTPVILYFYPKDDTPGCTTEACDFRDNMQRISHFGATVYGISKDSLQSHEQFSTKHGFNFTLLSDADHKVHELYQAVEGGKTVRSTFLINAQGKIAHVWPKVQVNGHVAAVIKTLETL